MPRRVVVLLLLALLFPLLWIGAEWLLGQYEATSLAVKKRRETRPVPAETDRPASPAAP